MGIVACQAKGHWEQALELLARMRAASVAPNLDTYNAALRVCTVARRWETALSLLNDMPRIGLVPNRCSYNDAIDACEGGGQAELALNSWMPWRRLRKSMRAWDTAMP